MAESLEAKSLQSILSQRSIRIVRIVSMAAFIGSGVACGGGTSGPGVNTFVGIQTPTDGATIACLPKSTNLCQCEIGVSGKILDTIDFSRQSIHVVGRATKNPANMWYVEPLPANVTEDTWSQLIDDVGGQPAICTGDTFVLFAAVIDQGAMPYVGENPTMLSSLPLQIFQFIRVTIVRPDQQDCPATCPQG